MSSIFQEAHKKAIEAARKAADEMYYQIGDDFFGCGFAWVNIQVDGRSTIAKEFKKLGFEKDYQSGLILWNPSGSPVQNIDVKEAGARAYAKVMREETGIEAIFARSRLD